MKPINNTEQYYGVIAILLHWLMAILIIALTVLGLYMVRLPDVGFNIKKIMLILYHKEFGMLVLFLVVIRLFWRIRNVTPLLAEQTPDWQQVAARLVHFSFYGMMFAMPLTGWLMSSAAGFPVTFFGLFNLPDLISQNNYLFQKFIDIHKWLGYGLIFLMIIHVGAALRHHFITKDDTLRKIWF